jgi:hypothetical protein
VIEFALLASEPTVVGASGEYCAPNLDEREIIEAAQCGKHLSSNVVTLFYPLVFVTLGTSWIMLVT